MGTATSPPGSSAAWVWGHMSPLRPAVVNGSTAFTRSVVVVVLHDRPGIVQAGGQRPAEDRVD